MGVNNDRGREYDFKKFCRESLLRHPITMSYTPELNGVVARRNMILVDKINDGLCRVTIKLFGESN